MQRFEGKSVLITGAASGIGRATAERLAAEGAQLLLCDVQDAHASETAELCRKAGAEARALHCDVGDDGQVAQAVGAAVEHFGKLDVVCNVAGILRYGHLAEFPVEDFQRILDINLTGTFRMCKEAIPHLLETGGNIVNTASICGLVALPHAAAYNSAKHGVIGLTKSAAGTGL